MPTTTQYPSVQDAFPRERGGPIARRGFQYQDYIGVSILLELLENDDASIVFLETHDDFLLIYKTSDSSPDIAEYIQVKSDEKESLWSVADISRRTPRTESNSIVDKQFSHDQYCEITQFRIVTYRDVTPTLAILKQPRSSPARTESHPRFASLTAEFQSRLPDLHSPKGNPITYWLKNCLWQTPGSKENVHQNNINRVLRLAETIRGPIPGDFAERVAYRLLRMTYERSNMDPILFKHEKAISKDTLTHWFHKEVNKYFSKHNVAGCNLTRKLKEISAPDDIIRSALEFRRFYSEEVRTPRYLSSEQVNAIYQHVREQLNNLRLQQLDGTFDLNGFAFYSHCVQSVKDKMPGNVPNTEYNRNLAVGALYDVTDRCLHQYRTKQ